MSHMFIFFFSSRRRHTRFSRDWSSDVCSSDLTLAMRKWRNLRFMSRRANGKERFSILLNLVIAAIVFLVFVGIIYADAPVPRDRSEERRVGKEGRWERAPG